MKNVKPSGIRCPVCRTDDSDVEQTIRINGRVRRYRRCRKCWARFRTSEKWDPPRCHG